MNYDYDIFISFSQSEKYGVDLEWSLKFCNLTDNLLNKITNEKPVIITSADIEARINMFHITHEEIYSNSAIFFIILSEESLNDKQFIEEINEFSQYLKYTRDGKIEKSMRVFKIMSSPVPFNKLPDFLKFETSYNFYETNVLNGRTKLFDLTYNSKKDNVFWSRLVDLAYDTADSINYIRSGINNFVKEIDNTVYLATTTPDQEESRDIIKRDLKQSGFRVLPDFELPENADIFHEIVTDLVQKSSYSIHIMGGYYGNYLENLQFSAVEYQNKIVAGYLKTLPKNRSFERIIWISSDIKIADQKQRLYLGRLKRDESISRAEIVESPLEDIKSIIDDTVVKKSTGTIKRDNRIMFFQYSEKGKDEISDIISILKKKGSFEIITTEMLEQEDILQTYWDKLLEADVLLFYYNGNKFWLDFKIKDALKIRGYKKATKELKVIIISENENTPYYDNIKNYNIININEIQTKLIDFVP